MSLYYEAAAILANAEKVGGSLKSRVYGKKDLKSSPANVFALITESTKWSGVVKEVVEKSGILREEKKLDPVLVTLLVHDLILAKKGIAAPQKHPLRLAIERHKARLNAEFTKIRIRRSFATVDLFRESINNGQNGSEVPLDDAPDDTSKQGIRHPRWVRVNTLKTSLDDELATTFAAYEQRDRLSDVIAASGNAKVLHVDKHISYLLALPPQCDLSKSKAYQDGKVIFQDKASCFPAQLLNLEAGDGDIIDACAAPGNKTTHLAALVTTAGAEDGQKVFAFERNNDRTKILKKMVTLAGANELVTIKGSTDFLSVKPSDPTYNKVGAILLDPSCSGSGIVGRDDEPQLFLPNRNAVSAEVSSKSKKRKRGLHSNPKEPSPELEVTENDEVLKNDGLAERLASLSAFQSKLLDHAMHFPAAKKIVYSTCSIHAEENEAVVMKVMTSDTAKRLGWRVLLRVEQTSSLQKWEMRGNKEACRKIMKEQAPAFAKVMGVSLENFLSAGLTDTPLSVGIAEGIAESCIRCERGTADGTMGFFVAGFVKDDEETRQAAQVKTLQKVMSTLLAGDEDKDEKMLDEGDASGANLQSLLSLLQTTLPSDDEATAEESTEASLGAHEVDDDKDEWTDISDDDDESENPDQGTSTTNSEAEEWSGFSDDEMDVEQYSVDPTEEPALQETPPQPNAKRRKMKEKEHVIKAVEHVGSWCR